jgi:xanthine/uracil permease
VLTGLGIMNVDSNLFRDLPVLVQSLISNGLIIGVLLSIMLEIFIKWDRSSEVVK